MQGETIANATYQHKSEFEKEKKNSTAERNIEAASTRFSEYLWTTSATRWKTTLTRHFRGQKWDFQTWEPLENMASQWSARLLLWHDSNSDFFFFFKASHWLQAIPHPPHTHTVTLCARLPPTDTHLDGHYYILCIRTLNQQRGNSNSSKFTTKKRKVFYIVDQQMKWNHDDIRSSAFWSRLSSARCLQDNEASCWREREPCSVNECAGIGRCCRCEVICTFKGSQLEINWQFSSCKSV